MNTQCSGKKLENKRRKLITTELIIVEIADGLASLWFRAQAVEILTALQSSPLVEVVIITSNLLAAGIDLYSKRPDKDWGLTDCVSFVVMGERGLAASLSIDRHFQEAGFRALLRESPK